MLLAHVLGNVVSTQKNHRYHGGRLLVVQPVDLDGHAVGQTLLALDSLDAGAGDLVVVVQEGWSASTAATGRDGAAIDAAVVAIVDHIDPA